MLGLHYWEKIWRQPIHHHGDRRRTDSPADDHDVRSCTAVTIRGARIFSWHSADLYQLQFFSDPDHPCCLGLLQAGTAVWPGDPQNGAQFHLSAAVPGDHTVPITFLLIGPAGRPG